MKSDAATVLPHVLKDGHGSHAVTVGEYTPGSGGGYVDGGQTVHGPPSGPVYPLLQMHAEADSLVLESTGQVKDAVTAVAAVVLEYVSSGQRVQSSRPIVILYVLAAHAVHGPPYKTT